MSRPSRTLCSLAVASALLLAACGGQQNSGQPASTGGSGGSNGGPTLVNAGKLTVCTHLAYAPFEFPDDSGKIVGFDIDIANLIAKDMGLAPEVEVVDVPFEQVTSGAALTAGRCDLGIAGMTITPKRSEAVAMSQPYFDATQALLVKKGSGITNLAQLKGRDLGVQTDTTGQIYANDNAAANGYSTVVFEDLPTSVNAVKSGRADAIINDNGVLLDFAKKNPDTEVVAEFHTGEQYGIGAKKNDPNAKAILDHADKAIAASRENGQYDEIYKKWFGDLPQSAITQDAAPTGTATN